MSKLRNKVNELLLRYKNGEESAFKELFDITYSSLTIVAAKYINDWGRAEDAVSEAYITVYQKISLFDGSKDGFNWLCKIVENKAKDIWRAQREIAGIELFDIPTTKDIEQVEGRHEVFQMLSQLEEEERKIIELKYIDEKTMKEVAAELSLSISQVERRLSRILKKLKRLNDERIKGNV